MTSIRKSWAWLLGPLLIFLTLGPAIAGFTVVSPILSGAASTVATLNLTPNKPVISNSLGKIAVATGTCNNTTYLRGDGQCTTVSGGGGGGGVSLPIAESDVTNLVSDLAGKAASSHSHAAGDITSGTLTAARLGSGTPSSSNFLRGDSSWHALAESDIANLTSDLAGKAASSHSHSESDITGLTSDLAGKAAVSHSHSESDITGLVSDLASKAASSHSHAESDITGLVSDLAGKASTSHSHGASDITSGTLAAARLGTGTPSSANFLRGDSSWQALAESDVSGLVSDLAGKASSSHSHSASDITSGTIGTARLGSGTADSTTFLRGDNTWATVSSGGLSGTLTAGQVAYPTGTSTLSGKNAFFFDSTLDRLGIGTAGSGAVNDKIEVRIADGSSGGLSITTPTYTGGFGINLDTSGNGYLFHNGARLINFMTSATIRGILTSAGQWNLGGSADPGSTKVLVTNVTASDVGLAVKGAASQSGNLVETRNSSGTVLNYIDAVGDLYLRAAPTADLMASTKKYVDDAAALKVNLSQSANTVLARAAGTTGSVSGVALSASQLLGRGSTGDVAAITLGTNLSMSGTTLNAAGTTPAYLRYTGVTGRGSTKTTVVRWSTVADNNGGSDLSATDSSTLGFYYTVNTSGVYTVAGSLYQVAGASTVYLGVGANVVDISANTESEIRTSQTHSSGAVQGFSWSGYIASGSKVWLSSYQAPSNTYPLLNQFSIARVN